MRSQIATAQNEQCVISSFTGISSRRLRLRVTKYVKSSWLCNMLYSTMTSSHSNVSWWDTSLDLVIFNNVKNTCQRKAEMITHNEEGSMTMRNWKRQVVSSTTVPNLTMKSTISLQVLLHVIIQESRQLCAVPYLYGLQLLLELKTSVLG